MATMIPDVPVAATESSAELEVFQLLKEQMPDEFHFITRLRSCSRLVGTRSNVTGLRELQANETAMRQRPGHG